VVVFVLAMGCGQLGTGLTEAKTTVKELIQLGEISLVAVWMAQVGTRWRVRATCGHVFALAGMVLLILGTFGWIHPLGLSDAKWGAFTILAAPFLVVVLGRSRPWLGAVPGALAGLAFPHAGPLLVWCGVVGVSSLALGRRYRPALLAVPVALAASLLPFQAGIWKRLDPHYDATHLRRSVIEARLALASPYYAPLGAGLGQYKRSINHLRAYGAPEPHAADTKVPRDGNSQYLLILVESGVLGCAAFCFLLAMAFRAAWQRNQRDLPDEREDRRAVALGILALAGASIFSLTLSRGIGIWAGALVGLAFDPPPRAPNHQRLMTVLSCWLGVAILFFLSLALNGGRTGDSWPGRANRWLTAPYHETKVEAGPRIVILPDQYMASSADAITLEAEAALEIMPPFTAVRSVGASGDMALAIPEGRGKGIGRASWQVNVPTAGRYVLSARVRWADGCGNSIAFTCAGREVHLSDDLYEEWHQVEARVPLELPAGSVELRAVNLEDGIMVDYLGLRPVRE
jgi:hypothetical protein